MSSVLLCIFAFLGCLRFPRGRSLSSILLARYGEASLTAFRRTQKAHFRRQKVELDLRFLNTCKQCNIIPKFLHFKVSLPNFVHSREYTAILHQLLDYEINSKFKSLNKLKKNYLHQSLALKNSVSWLDFKILSSKINKYNRFRTNVIKETHDRKLYRLGINSTSPSIPNDVITNLSNYSLSEDEQKLLSFGLDYGLPPRPPKFCEFFLPFEKFMSSISHLPIYNPGADKSWRALSAKVSDLAHCTFRSLKNKLPLSVNFMSNYVTVLNNLRQNTDIVISKQDKGRGVVILNKLDYINKVYDVLSDVTKFVKLNEDPFKVITRLEDKLNRFLRPLREKVISLGTYNFIFAKGSIPGVLYGLPKVHKEGCPIRPILSAIGSFNFNLAKFFVPLLSQFTANQYTVLNSYTFVDDLKSIHVPDSYVLASFDVKNLFTNIPLDESINICKEKAFRDSSHFSGFTEEQFTKLLELALKESVFLFNGELFKQIEGVAMGSPLGPVIANAFMCHHEETWLRDCPSDFKPVMYKRYVDDCFFYF